jgi:hypothetical protein
MSMQKRRQNYPNLGPSVGSGPAPPPAAVLAVRGDMTEGEARQAVQRVKEGLRAVGVMRAALLDLEERKGWQALGYASWRECVVAEFGQSQATLYRQLEAARTEREISHGEKTPVFETAIPESVLRPLAGLPVSDKPVVLADAKANAPGGKVRAKDVRAARGRHILKSEGVETLSGISVSDAGDVQEQPKASEIEWEVKASRWEADEFVVSIRPPWEKSWNDLPVGQTLTERDAILVGNWLKTAMPTLIKVAENLTKES